MANSSIPFQQLSTLILSSSQMTLDAIETEFHTRILVIPEGAIVSVRINVVSTPGWNETIYDGFLLRIGPGRGWALLCDAFGSFKLLVDNNGTWSEYSISKS